MSHVHNKGVRSGHVMHGRSIHHGPSHPYIAGTEHVVFSPGCVLIMLSCIDRSRMTMDPRIPTLPGQSTSGFHQCVYSSCCLSMAVAL